MLRNSSGNRLVPGFTLDFFAQAVCYSLRPAANCVLPINTAAKSVGSFSVHQRLQSRALLTLIPKHRARFCGARWAITR
jgi:hypothetical protein